MFLISVVSLRLSSFLLPTQYMYQVDGDAGDEGIAINLLPLLAKHLEQQIDPLSHDTSVP